MTTMCRPSHCTVTLENKCQFEILKEIWKNMLRKQKYFEQKCRISPGSFHHLVRQGHHDVLAGSLNDQVTVSSTHTLPNPEFSSSDVDNPTSL